jgi:hypothetical protein
LGKGYGGAALPGIEEETDSAAFGMLKTPFHVFSFNSSIAHPALRRC